MSSKNVAKNTISNIMFMFIRILMSFLLKSLIVEYLGEEILGVNTTIVDTVNFLNVVEVGVQTSIIYKMYQPILENNIDRQKKLFNLYRISYRVVGTVILFLGLLVLPFLERIVNTEIKMSTVYSVYVLHLFSICLNYYFGYYRIVFVVHQRSSVCTNFDILSSIIMYVLKFIAIIHYKNYILYISLSYVQSILSYAYIKHKAKREYFHIIQKSKTDRKDIKNLFFELKQMIVTSVANYLIGSIDNIVVSYNYGSIKVANISFYSTITNNAIEVFLIGIISAVSPTWGNYLHQDKSNNEVYEMLENSIFIMYCLLLMLFVPTFALIDSFVSMWVGEKYIISETTTCLIILYLFINYLNEPVSIVIRNTGLFEEEKINTILMAIVKISFSFFLVKLIGINIIYASSVIIGILAIFLRFRALNKKVLQVVLKDKMKHYLSMLEYIFTYLLLSYFAKRVISYISVSNHYIEFIFRGITLEILLIIYIVCRWRKTNKFSFAKKKLLSYIKK